MVSTHFVSTMGKSFRGATSNGFRNHPQCGIVVGQNPFRTTSGTLE